ncbi:MAG: signal peptidase I [Planctomycetes bacterium]|nr:signal peptidase I [Planctomycetota bacterium]
MISLPSGRAALLLALLVVIGFRVFLIGDAFLLARRTHDAPLKRYQRWWAYIGFALVIWLATESVALVLKSYVAEAFLMPTRSMSPTLQPGDRILVDKLWTKAADLRRGDVVVYRSDGPGSPLYVMRVAGLPGDEVEIRDERVFVNGTEWKDPHAVFVGELPPVDEIANLAPVAVPADCFFVLGDHRRRANDSRLRGPIPLSDYHGKTRLIYWSQERTYLDPDDTAYTLGPIRWDRIGQRLD